MELNLFADDDILMRKLENVNDCMVLQQDLDKIGGWSKKNGKWISI